MTLVAPPPEGPPPASRHGAGPREVTVVVAAYQAAATLGRCLDSVLAQDPAPAEVVVVDDCSTDATGDVLARYADRVRAVRLPRNLGEAGAKNAGVAAVATPLVALVDADDVVLPGWLAAVSGALGERPDLDVVTADAWLVTAGTRQRRAYAHGSGPGIPFPVEGQRREILRRNFVLGFAAFRRDPFLAAGGFDDRLAIASDWSAWAGMVLGGSRVGLVDEPLAEYHVIDGSLSSDVVNVLRARVDVLTRLAGHPRLTAEDREVLAASLAGHTATLELREARDALRSGDADARARALRVARSGRHGAVTRGKAAATAAFPLSLSRWFLRRVSSPESMRASN
jgi:glycosyltransferase involved in cell wall biosynthesis